MGVPRSSAAMRTVVTLLTLAVCGLVAATAYLTQDADRRRQALGAEIETLRRDLARTRDEQKGDFERMRLWVSAVGEQTGRVHRQLEDSTTSLVTGLWVRHGEPGAVDLKARGDKVIDAGAATRFFLGADRRGWVEYRRTDEEKGSRKEFRWAPAGVLSINLDMGSHTLVGFRFGAAGNGLTLDGDLCLEDRGTLGGSTVVSISGTFIRTKP